MKHLAIKNHFFFSAILLFAAACGSLDGDQELTRLVELRDSLGKVQDELSARIAEIDLEIAKKDTTKVLTTVTVIPPKIGAFDHYIEVYGNVESDHNATLYAETNGNITGIAVREGQKVRKGQILLRQDDRIVRNNIRETKTQLELAQTLFEKQSKLWEQKIGSEVQYLESKNQKESLESRLATLETQLDQTTVKAPFDGTVDEIFPKLGEMVGPQSPLVRLVNLDEIYIKADISESYLSKIKEGSEVLVRFPSIDYEQMSKVAQSGNYINPANRTFRILVRVEKNNKLLRPNMMASLRVRDYHVDTAMVLPNRLVQQDPTGDDFVYIVEDVEDGLGIVKKAPIKSGVSYRELTEILDGLNVDTQIIDKGSRSVKQEQQVRIISGEELENTVQNGR